MRRDHSPLPLLPQLFEFESNATLLSSSLASASTTSSSVLASSSERTETYRINFHQKSIAEISLACLSALANLIIVITICVNTKLRKRTNILIANLCLASIAYDAILVLRSSEFKSEWNLNYDSQLCGIFAVVHRLPFPVMSMSTMFLSLERSQSATAMIPFQQFPSKTLTFFKIVAIWSTAVLITLPSAFINVFDPSATVSSPRKCRKVLLANNASIHMAYVVINISLVHIIPSIVLIAELVRMRAKINFLIFRQPEVNCRTDERLRLVRNACLFTALFIICWLPIGLNNTFYDLPQEIFPTTWKLNRRVSFIMTGVFLITNYFIFSIPILLFVLSQRLRESVSTWVYKVVCCLCSPAVIRGRCRNEHQRRRLGNFCDYDEDDDDNVRFLCCCDCCGHSGESTSEIMEEMEMSKM